MDKSQKIQKSVAPTQCSKRVRCPKLTGVSHSGTVEDGMWYFSDDFPDLLVCPCAHRSTYLRTIFTTNQMWRATPSDWHLLERKGSSSMGLLTGCTKVGITIYLNRLSFRNVAGVHQSCRQVIRLFAVLQNIYVIVFGCQHIQISIFEGDVYFLPLT